jgi:hypothetical protein
VLAQLLPHATGHARFVAHWCYELYCHCTATVLLLLLPQVSLMQHELEALRQGLSGRQAAAMEAARGEYAAALASCHSDLGAAREQLSGQALLAQRQGRALGSILRILAAHAGEEALPGDDEGSSSGSGSGSGSGDPVGGSSAPESAAAGPDPAKVVAFVEAVSGSMLEVAQQWQAEKAEMAAALEAAEAVHAQLESLLDRERGDNRGMTAGAVEMQAALAEAEQRLEAALERLHEVRGRGVAQAYAYAAAS